MADKHFHDFPLKAAPDPTDLFALEQDPGGPTNMMVKIPVLNFVSTGAPTFDTLAAMKADTNHPDRKHVILLGINAAFDIPAPNPQYVYNAASPDANNDGDRIKPTDTGIGLGCYIQIV